MFMSCSRLDFPLQNTLPHTVRSTGLQSAVRQNLPCFRSTVRISGGNDKCKATYESASPQATFAPKHLAHHSLQAAIFLRRRSGSTSPAGAELFNTWLLFPILEELGGNSRADPSLPTRYLASHSALLEPTPHSTIITGYKRRIPQVVPTPV